MYTSNVQIKVSIFYEGVIPDAQQNAVSSTGSVDQRSRASSLLLTLIYIVHDFLQPRTKWFFDSTLYRK